MLFHAGVTAARSPSPPPPPPPRRLKIRLSTQLDLPRYAMRHVLSLLHPRLTYTLSLSRKAELADVLFENDADEDEAATRRRVRDELLPRIRAWW